MQAINQPNRIELNKRAVKYVGKTVTDTYNRTGVVQSAFVRDSIIILSVMSKGNHWYTDNEHATITRNHCNQHGEGTDWVPVAGNRGEIEES